MGHVVTRGRGINSGIVMKTCTEDAEIVISGHKEQEARMLAAMEAAPDGVAILWPPRPDGRDRNPPISVDELKATYPQAVQQGLVVRAVSYNTHPSSPRPSPNLSRRDVAVGYWQPPAGRRASASLSVSSLGLHARLRQSRRTARRRGCT